MKTKPPLIILVVILLASCAPAPAIIEPTATKTLIPTETFTPEPTVTNTPDATATDSASPTPTEAAIPDWLKPFIDGGYDKKNELGYRYIMITEGNTQYASSDAGIDYKGLKIFSWTISVVYYDKQGALHTDGIMFDGVCRNMGGPDPYWATFTTSMTTLEHESCPSIAFYKGIRTETDSRSVGDHFILKASRNKVLNKNKLKIFVEIFPDDEPVFIDGIGFVLPIINADYGQDVQWTK